MIKVTDRGVEAFCQLPNEKRLTFVGRLTLEAGSDGWVLEEPLPLPKDAETAALVTATLNGLFAYVYHKRYVNALTKEK